MNKIGKHIIYLVVFANIPQIVAQGINLIFFIPCAVVATIIYLIKKQIQIKVILPVIAGGITGVIIASYLKWGIEESTRHRKQLGANEPCSPGDVLMLTYMFSHLHFIIVHHKSM